MIKAQFLYCFCYALMINDIAANIHSQLRVAIWFIPAY